MREKIGLCTKKGFHIVLVFALVVGMFGTFYPAKTARAKTVLAIRVLPMYADGRYIYYVGEAGEVQWPKSEGQETIYGTIDGIRRLDTKTGKVKKIYEKKDNGWIYQILVKGNYIYFSKTAQHKSSDPDGVYRIKKNGKSLKKLASGSNIKLVGDRIYYTDGSEKSMKLDGSDKKSQKGVKYSWKASSPDRCRSYDVKEITATSGNYYYYVKNSSCTLIRMDLKTGKTKKLYTGGKNEKIDEIIVHKANVIVYVQRDGEYMKKYYINASGKKTLLRNRAGFTG